MGQMCMTDAGTTQDNFILPAPPVGGLPLSQDWFGRMKLVPIILPSGKNILADTMFKITIGRGTDFPRSRNRGRKRGKAYLKRNSRFSPKTLLVTFKKHTLLSKRTFQRHFENRNSRYLTTLIFVSVTPN